MKNEFIENVIERTEPSRTIKNQTIDMVQTHDIKLCDDAEYNIKVIDACVILDKLKVLFEFEDTSSGECYNWLEVLTLGSQEYELFLDAIYFHEYSNVIAVELDDFSDFLASCKGNCIKDGHIYWRKVDVFALPITSTSLRYDE